MSRKPVNHLTDDARAIVVALQQKRDDLGLTDAAFHRKFLPRSYSTWIRLQGDSYAGDTESVVSEYRQALENISRIEAFAPKTSGDEPFHEFPVFEAVVEAVHRAHAREDENRLVVFLAPTGGGKDAICRHLKKRSQAAVVEATESWRKSYYASCADVCRVIHVDGPWRSTRECERDMLASLNRRNGTLVFNEGNYFGPQTLNMIKLILNQTGTVVVICAIPQIFDRMKLKSWFESSQLIRRAVAIIEAPELDPDQVEPFLEPFTVAKEDMDPACRLIAAAANGFGLFNMIKRVVENLQAKKQYASGKPVPLSAFERAIAEAEAFLRLYR